MGFSDGPPQEPCSYNHGSSTGKTLIMVRVSSTGLEAIAVPRMTEEQSLIWSQALMILISSVLAKVHDNKLATVLTHGKMTMSTSMVGEVHATKAHAEIYLSVAARRCLVDGLVKSSQHINSKVPGEQTSYILELDE